MRTRFSIWCLFIFLLMGIPAHAKHVQNATFRSLSLEDCISIALANNRVQAIASEKQSVARAQHKQALSSYWPRLQFTTLATMQNRDPYILAEVGSIPVPGSGGYVDYPDVELKLRDKGNVDFDLRAEYTLWAGGRRSAVARRAEIGVESAREDSRRQTLQLIRDVKKTYYGLVLARLLKSIGHDALERMQAAQDITELFYNQGLANVRKTDFLRIKLLAESASSIVAELDSNVELAQAALTNMLGLEWQTEIDIRGKEIPFDPLEQSKTDIVAEAYQFNVDMKSMALGLEEAEQRIRQAEADYMPVVSLFGTVRQTVNDYDKGLVTSDLKTGSVGGVSIYMPLFEGFRREGAVEQAKARLRMLEHRSIQLKEGLALQLRTIHLESTRAARQVRALREAMKTARENRALHERAYALQMVDTRDVTESLIAESMLEAQYLRAVYAHYEQQVAMEYVIGKHVSDRMAKEE